MARDARGMRSTDIGPDFLLLFHYRFEYCANFGTNWFEFLKKIQIPYDFLDFLW